MEFLVSQAWCNVGNYVVLNTTTMDNFFTLHEVLQSAVNVTWAWNCNWLQDGGLNGLMKGGLPDTVSYNLELGGAVWVGGCESTLVWRKSDTAGATTWGLFRWTWWSPGTVTIRSWKTDEACQFSTPLISLIMFHFCDHSSTLSIRSLYAC